MIKVSVDGFLSMDVLLISINDDNLCKMHYSEKYKNSEET